VEIGFFFGTLADWWRANVSTIFLFLFLNACMAVGCGSFNYMIAHPDSMMRASGRVLLLEGIIVTFLGENV
jgi:hypothetical protein